MSASPPDPPALGALDLAVLSFVLALHPAPVHRSVLERAFSGEDWPSSVSALRVDGLLHREGELLLVSRAAARFDELGL